MGSLNTIITRRQRSSVRERDHGKNPRSGCGVIFDRHNRLAHFRTGSLPAFLVLPALHAFFEFGLLAFLTLLFFLAFLECLRTTSGHGGLLSSTGTGEPAYRRRGMIFVH
ncbi:MAG TPA: hypothetical protein VMB85_15210 [Bryobacteraceae bacterium]|nr:hypothetical protein [Bryobacteraceae bacterium]